MNRSSTGAVEDEVHFCIACPALEEARVPLIQKLENVDPTFYSQEEKFRRIISAANKNRKIAKYFYVDLYYDTAHYIVTFCR